MAVNDLIKSARKNRNMTQERFAEYVGVSLATVRNIEQGRRRPSGKTAVKLARMAGLRLEDLLTNDR